MGKVRITADAVLAIIKGIFDDEDINTIITDTYAPEQWRDKKIQDVLNVDYYAFKHRPISSQSIINDLIKDEETASKLTGLNRSFCLLSLGEIDRLFSKDVDMLALSATLDYYIQTNKIQLLEYLIEDCNISTSGLRIPVAFGNETRQAVIIFNRPIVTDIQTATTFGEMATIEIEVNIILYPSATSYSNYEISLSYYSNVTNENGEIVNGTITAKIPVSSFTSVLTSVQKAVPSLDNPHDTGNINLSKARSFVLVFDGYNNEVINYIVDKTLQGNYNEQVTDNNEPFVLTVKRGDKTYSHTVVVKDHQITVMADTNNETHTLSLVKRGL